MKKKAVREMSFACKYIELARKHGSPESLTAHSLSQCAIRCALLRTRFGAYE